MFALPKRYALASIFVAASFGVGASPTHDNAPVGTTLYPGATLTQNVDHNAAAVPPYAAGHELDGDHYVLILGGIRPDIFALVPPRDPTTELAAYSSALSGMHPSSLPAGSGGHAPVVVPLPAGWLLLASGLAVLRQTRRASACA